MKQNELRTPLLAKDKELEKWSISTAEKLSKSIRQKMNGLTKVHLNSSVYFYGSSLYCIRV